MRYQSKVFEKICKKYFEKLLNECKVEKKVLNLVSIITEWVEAVVHRMGKGKTTAFQANKEKVI